MSSGPISITTINGGVAISGNSTGTGTAFKAGVQGLSDDGVGVFGRSLGIAVQGECINEGFGPGSEDGVYGTSGTNGVHGVSYGADGSGVLGENLGGTAGTGNGVTGSSGADQGSGVWGLNRGKGVGVTGTSNAGDGVMGQGHLFGVHGVTSSDVGYGVFGQGQSGGVYGVTTNAQSSGVQGENLVGGGLRGNGVTGLCNQSGGSGIWGNNNGGGTGVTGTSDTGEGVVGRGSRSGVHGVTTDSQSSGVQGDNLGNTGPNTGNGVTGLCDQPKGSGVWGNHTGGGWGVSGTSDSAGGIGIYGRGGKLAGCFEGDVWVTGDLSLVNQDCAEDFDIAGDDAVEPGTVMAIDKDGGLRVCQLAYNKRVAGVIAGAGNLKPAIILGKQQFTRRRMPIALLGKVYCKVDAISSPIEVGDLLTTSSNPGYAMKAIDTSRSSGAVIGKALCACESGLGLIPILVALQ